MHQILCDYHKCKSRNGHDVGTKCKLYMKCYRFHNGQSRALLYRYAYMIGIMFSYYQEDVQYGIEINFHSKFVSKQREIGMPLFYVPIYLLDVGSFLFVNIWNGIFRCKIEMNFFAGVTAVTLKWIEDPIHLFYLSYFALKKLMRKQQNSSLFYLSIHLINCLLSQVVHVMVDVS